MMNLFTKRRGAAAIAGAVAASTLILAPMATTAGASAATFTCGGIDGDVAGSVGAANKSSKQLLDLLASLGGSATLSLPVDVTVNAPSTVKTGADPFDASFTYNITLPDSLLKSVKTLLGLNKIGVKDASFEIAASGAGTGSMVGTLASQELSLATSPVTVSQTLTGKVTPTKSGLISYRPGATKLSVVVNGEVAGQAKIGTITVTCTATNLLGSTTVKPAGAPNITKSPLEVPATANQSATVKLDDGVKVTPDEGNPIQWDRLSIVTPPSAGSATAANGSVTFTAPATNGTYDVTYSVCAGEKTIPGEPGVSEVQTLNFNDASYFQRDFFNTHPIFFTLKFGDQETAPIMTSFVDVFGVPVPYNANDEVSRFLHNWRGEFRAPSPATVQAALEALPNVAPGEIIVSEGPTATDLKKPYKFTFAGAQQEKDVTEVTVGQWVTWLPNEQLAAILAAASGLSGGGSGGGSGEPAPVIPTFEELLGQRLAGLITDDQFFDLWGKRVQADILAGIDVQAILNQVTGWFPKTPATATLTPGEPAIAAEVVQLCTEGVLQFIVTGGIDPNATTTTLPSVTTTTARQAVLAATANRSNSTGAARVQSNANFAG